MEIETVENFYYWTYL